VEADDDGGQGRGPGPVQRQNPGKEPLRSGSLGWPMVGARATSRASRGPLGGVGAAAVEGSRTDAQHRRRGNRVLNWNLYNGRGPRLRPASAKGRPKC